METINNFNISKKNKNFFNSQGYIFLKNTIDKKLVLKIKDVIFQNLKFQLNRNIKKKDFQKQLKLLRKNKKKFGDFFDSLQTLGLGYSLITSTKIIDLVSNLLNAKKNSLTFTDISIRLDPPFDKRNSLDWHQDSSYFRQSSNGKNGLVLWIPLEKINFKKGPLELLKNSHKLGPLFVDKSKPKNKYSSGQRAINRKKIKDYKDIIKKELNVGDAVITNLDLIHRSGVNSSGSFRITIIGRFHNMLKKGFKSGLNKYIYTDKNINQKVHGF